MTRDDFRKRTFLFDVRCIRLAESLPKSLSAQIVAKQLIRSATSVGANYRAAARGKSRADFIAKMGIVEEECVEEECVEEECDEEECDEEECDEALYWIEVLNELGLVAPARTTELQNEANEILAIVVSSIKTARAKTRAQISK
jgi:four helix bundle protein